MEAEPQVQRIGKYKPAGDQLLRSDMSDAQREVSERLVGSIYENFVRSVAQDRGKSEQEVEDLLNSGPHKVEDLAAGGWITAPRYLNEIEDLLKPRTGGPSGSPYWSAAPSSPSRPPAKGCSVA